MTDEQRCYTHSPQLTTPPEKDSPFYGRWDIHWHFEECPHPAFLHKKSLFSKARANETMTITFLSWVASSELSALHAAKYATRACD